MKRTKILDRLEFLKETHRFIDIQIQDAIKHNVPDFVVTDMKKKKLDLKDQIERMERDIKKDV